jgi:hypothetical protein
MKAVLGAVLFAAGATLIAIQPPVLHGGEVLLIWAAFAAVVAGGTMFVGELIGGES